MSRRIEDDKKAHRAQFFGLEQTLDLAASWVGPLLIATLQNTAQNLRVPIVVQLVTIVVATNCTGGQMLRRDKRMLSSQCTLPDTASPSGNAIGCIRDGLTFAK